MAEYRHLETFLRLHAIVLGMIEGSAENKRDEMSCKEVKDHASI